MMPKLTIRLSSFSFRDGAIPTDPSGNGGGFVFDCRALPNPGRDPAFKQLTGTGPEVKAFLDHREEVEEFYSHALAMVVEAAKNYQKRGFSHLMVSFGCTGGQHRSVYYVERLAEELRLLGFDVIKDHTQLPLLGLQ